MIYDDSKDRYYLSVMRKMEAKRKELYKLHRQESIKRKMLLNRNILNKFRYTLKNNGTLMALAYVSTIKNVNMRDTFGRSLLYIACEHDDEVVVRSLISRGANINIQSEDGLTPLQRSFAHANPHISRILLEEGCDPNAYDKYGFRPIHYVAQYDYTMSDENMSKIFKILLQKGADVNALSKKGLTALHATTSAGRIEQMEWLLNAGADPNGGSIEGSETPLMRSIGPYTYRGDEAFELLLEYGASVHAFNWHGRNVLHLSAEYNVTSYIGTILEKGVDINGKDKHGYTALHWAVEKHSVDVVDMLLGYGADWDVKNERGKGVLDTKLRCAEDNIIRDMLLKHIGA